MVRIRLSAGIKPVLALLVTVLASGFGSAVTAAEGEVGQALLINGAVFAREANGEARLLDRGAPFFESETIATEDKSFAVLKMRDGTRFSLRGGSELEIQEYLYGGEESTEPDKATYGLVKGGLRAITGLLGKKDPRANVLVTRVGTIGIRGTEFDARLCEDKCDDEEAALESEHGRQAVRSQVIGRVILAKGESSARRVTETETRQLSRGSPVYLGDTLTTAKASFLAVAFRDESRLTVRPDSEVVLERYLFNRDQGGESEQSATLVKGGLRVLTGLIGKNKPASVRLKTSRGQIGIRGTGFDLMSRNPTFLHVWEGEVIFCDKVDEERIRDPLDEACIGNSQIVQTGQSLKADGEDGPELLGSLPPELDWPPEFRPDRLDVDTTRLFGAQDHDYSKEGLLVTVYDGHVVMFPAAEVPPGMTLRDYLDSLDGMNIGAGESLFSNGEETYRLEFSPLIQHLDETVRPGDVNDAYLGTLGLFPLATQGDGELCTLQ